MPDISMSGLFAGVLFGALGLFGWQVGRRQQSAGKMIVGVCLMVFSWVIPDGWMTWVVGAALTATLFYV